MGVKVRQKVKGKGKPWWVFISHNGQRASKMVGDKAAAEEVASTIRAKLQLGEFDFEQRRKPPIPTFELYAQGFMETYSAMNHKESTRDSYQSVLDAHLIPAFGEKPLDAITKKDVKEFIHLKMSESLATNTVKNMKRYLSKILAEAVDDEIIELNPASMTGKLIKKKTEDEHINPLTWEEKATFEDSAQEHYQRYYPLFLTMLRTGMRVGEAIGLQPGDLDFNGRFIEIRRAFAKKHLTSPKNGKTRRVDMSRGLAGTLQRHLTERKKEALRKGWGETPEWLFCNEKGGPVDIDNLRKRVFYKCLEKAGLRHITLHDLRHTYATLRIMKGDNIKDVSEQLGHSSIKITLDTYTHWIPGTKKSEVDELDSKTAPTSRGQEEKEEAQNE
jgi:integrase